jgi:hypothetical protein
VAPPGSMQERRDARVVVVWVGRMAGASVAVVRQGEDAERYDTLREAELPDGDAQFGGEVGEGGELHLVWVGHCYMWDILRSQGLLVTVHYEACLG